MKITIEELLDYIECPTRYDYRYIQKLDATLTERGSYSNEHSIEELFNKEIHKLCYHIFNYLQDGRYPSEYLLRQKWGKIWCFDKTLDDVLTDKAQRHVTKGLTRYFNPMKKFEVQGLKAIGNLHPKFKENPGTPILVGKRMIVKVGRHEVEITLDLVREIDNVIEIVDFKSGMKSKTKWDIKPMNLHIHHDLEVTAASLAFRQLTGAVEERITYYDILNNEEFVTKRSEEDYKILERVLDNVERALDQKIIYPVMNERCYDCPFQQHCKKRAWYKGEE